MNIRLLRRIAKVIQEKPREFDMGYWHIDTTIDWFQGEHDALCGLPKDKRISCTTTHCIAGWAQVLSPKRNCRLPADSDAQRLLGLTNEEADRLFHVDGGGTTLGWPRKFRGRGTNIWKPTVKQAAARIEHFIKTKGAE